MHLKATSFQAPNAESSVTEIVQYLSNRLHQHVEVINDTPWKERYEQLDHGKIHIGWICGWPYVKRVENGSSLELLAAPVMSAARYQGKPIYFSDVVVSRDSSYQNFADLRGSVWAYNEPGSHSGYNVVRYRLATLGETWSYFRQVVASGSHQNSLQMIRGGHIDASAVDSTVLEAELKHNPGLNDAIRVVASLGPSPIPPWVISKQLPEELRQSIRQQLLLMHTDPEGQQILARAVMDRFAEVEDRDYDPIRSMTKIAAHIVL